MLISVPISKGTDASGGMVTVISEEPVVSRMHPRSINSSVCSVPVKVRIDTTPGCGTSTQFPALKRTVRASSVIQTCQPGCGVRKTQASAPSAPSHSAMALALAPAEAGTIRMSPIVPTAGSAVLRESAVACTSTERRRRSSLRLVPQLRCPGS